MPTHISRPDFTPTTATSAPNPSSPSKHTASQRSHTHLIEGLELLAGGSLRGLRSPVPLVHRRIEIRFQRQIHLGDGGPHFVREFVPRAFARLCCVCAGCERVRTNTTQTSDTNGTKRCAMHTTRMTKQANKQISTAGAEGWCTDGGSDFGCLFILRC